VENIFLGRVSFAPGDPSGVLSSPCGRSYVLGFFQCFESAPGIRDFHVGVDSPTQIVQQEAIRLSVRGVAASTVPDPNDAKCFEFAKGRRDAVFVNAELDKLQISDDQFPVRVASMVPQFKFNPQQNQMSGAGQNPHGRACYQSDGTGREVLSHDVAPDGLSIRAVFPGAALLGHAAPRALAKAIIRERTQESTSADG
jgi:hypothetical protein